MAVESAILVTIGTSLASGLLKSVMQKAGDAVSNSSSVAGLKSAILGNLRPQLQDLESELSTLNELLSSVESMNPGRNNNLVLGWLKSVNAAANFADNILEDISYDHLRRQAESNRVDKLISSPDGSFVFRRKIGTRLHKFKSMAAEIYKKADKIGIRPVELVANPATYQPLDGMSTDLREIRENVDTSFVVGRQQEEDLIVGGLTKTDNHNTTLGVIALIGMSGVGKTTLARKIYDNAMVAAHYRNKKTWIFVSENFRLTRLLDEMLQSLTGETHQLTNIGAIEEKLQGCLQEERYLLVLDDVWNTDQQIWGSIRTSLLRVTGGCKSCIVLVTSQCREVASVMGAYITRDITTLSNNDAWELFEKKAFANKGRQQVSNWKVLGERILEKCGGLPLAISTLGSLLGSMNERRQWESVDESQVWNLPQLQGQTQIMPWLLLSFNHLPNATIKQCFAHCSVVIPKGSNLRDDLLIYYWAAHGFIQPKDQDHRSIIDIGRSYIQCMVSNGLMWQIREGTLNFCSMHDLMHELGLYVSRDRCLVVRQPDHLHKFHSGVEHLSIYGQSSWNCQRIVLEGDTDTPSTLRTLLCCGAPISIDIFTQATFLRQLNLSNCSLKEIPAEIGKLKHLRILGLCDNPLKYLPESVGRLYNLHVLDLSDCRELVELPKQVTKLLDLRIIDTTEAIHVPKGMGHLTRLTTLPVIKLEAGDGFKIKELGSLQHLVGDVVIKRLENIHCQGDAVEASLKSKAGISGLQMEWTEDPRDADCCIDEQVLEGLQPHPNLTTLIVRNYLGKRFSSWMSDGPDFNNLKHLTLINCKRCAKLPTLGSLPSLQLLDIDSMDSVEAIGSDFFYPLCDIKEVVVKSNIFPSLKNLYLENMPKLKHWYDPSMSHASLFPCLEVLNIVNCPSLVSAPSSCFQSIQELTIDGVNSGQSLLMILSSALNLTSLSVKNVEQLTSLSEPLLKCTSLRHIQIIGCNELVGLPPTLQKLSYLQKLEIKDCDGLTSLPDIEGLLTLTTLKIEDCKSVTQTPRGLASCVYIDSLSLFEFTMLNSLLDLGSLSRLQYLVLYPLSEEISVPPWLKNLSCLHTLTIGGFNNALDYFSGIDQLPTCLRGLILCGWPKLKSLPDELQSLTQLERLHLHDFDGVIALPDWLQNLSFLQTLAIWNCENMKHLPSLQTMHSLTRLTLLRIVDSPLLEERCRTDGGEERLKVPDHTCIEFD